MTSNRATPAPRPGISGSARSGVSLMEVLISVFVVSIGLLGIAALIPVANYALVETGKSDRSAACGQAAMRDIRVRRLIELVPTANQSLLVAGHTIVVDPLYFAKGGTSTTFGAALRRSTLHQQYWFRNSSLGAMGADEISRVFHWHDDLLFDMLDDNALRPRGFAAHGNAPVAEQSYSWFFTISPAAAEDAAAASATDGWQARKRFTVSVVVCYQREFDVPEQWQNLSKVLGIRDSEDKLRGVISGIQTTNPADFEPGQWVLLRGDRRNHATNTDVSVAEWYRVAAGSGTYYAVDGPYWPSREPPNRIMVVPGVLGVYTTSVEIDRGSEWLR